MHVHSQRSAMGQDRQRRRLGPGYEDFSTSRKFKLTRAVRDERAGEGLPPPRRPDSFRGSARQAPQKAWSMRCLVNAVLAVDRLDNHEVARHTP